MKLWLIQRPERSIGYDEFCSYVIRAQSEDEARQIAASKAADEGRTVWMDPLTTCTPIYEAGAPGVILDSFNAG